MNNLVDNFDDIDADHDGKLNFDEFQKYSKVAALEYERQFC